MPLHINPKRDRAWLRLARDRAGQPVSTCRAPTAIERLSAHGFTRRASGGIVWFEHADGRATPARATVEDAVKAGLEMIDADA